MNLSDFISAVKNRFSSGKQLRHHLPGTRNVTPIGLADRGDYNEAEEAATRETMARQSFYAESGPTYDPSGKYLCKDCKYRLPTDLDSYNALCTKVDGRISLITGSCNLFEYGRYAADSDALPPVSVGLLSPNDAGYQERPVSKAFGCLRCSHAKRAKYTDKDGRRLWCRRFGTHVQATACCAAHEGTDSITDGSLTVESVDEG